MALAKESLPRPDLLLHVGHRLHEPSRYSLRSHRIVVEGCPPLPYGTEVQVVLLMLDGVAAWPAVVRWEREGRMGLYFRSLDVAQTRDLHRALEQAGDPDVSGVMRRVSRDASDGG